MKKYKKNFYILITGRADYYILEKLFLSLKKKYNIFFIFIYSNGKDKTYFTIKKNLKLISGKIVLEYCYINKNISKSISNIINYINKKSYLINGELIVLGDRFETFAVSVASHLNKKKIIHFSGGEITEGSLDNFFRNSISLIADKHFVTSELHKKRLINLIGLKKNIFVSGSIVIDYIKKIKILSKSELENKYKFFFNKRNFLLTYHPETINLKNNKKNINTILKTLVSFDNSKIFICRPSNDPGSDDIMRVINVYRKKYKKKIKFFDLLGMYYYISLASYCDFVIGNSSSGLSEIPSIGVPTINLGNRQQGRPRARSVINCKIDFKSINKAIFKILNKKVLINKKNPFYKKNSLQLIKQKI